ncbi:MAG: hypothetical protein CMB99_01465 [Flavobacteriaceae bacterium]|nr:hypothetical protein [Flavobacteriaceae bacterium]
MFVTPDVARDIAEIVRQHHAAVAAVLLGPDAVSAADWDLAMGLGLVDPHAPPTGVMADMHMYGALLAHLQASEAQSRYGSTLSEFKSEVARHPVPMTEVEYQAAKWSAHNAGQYIVGLGNKKGATVGSSLIEADRDLDRRMREMMQDVIAARFGDEDAAERMRERGADAGLGPEFFDDSFRSTIKGMVSDIGHASNDWARDIQRIAHTESHTAISHGIKEHWKGEEEKQAHVTSKPPRRVIAYKLPRPDACKHCVRLHLDGDVPRLYFLDDLDGNGTNVGLRAAEWNAVIGSTHPWCGCSLLRVPALLTMPAGWSSGQSAPSLIGAGGRLVA